MKPQEILKQARTKSGYTQEVIAREIGISDRMYQRYESGKFPKYKGEAIEKLDKLLGTNLISILYDKTSRLVTQDRPPEVVLTDAHITLQDYINEIKDSRDRWHSLVSSILDHIERDTKAALAHQKAWVEYEAERASGGDDDKKDEIMNKMGKLVRGYLLGRSSDRSRNDSDIEGTG